MKTYNIGEWSEIYTFLKLLADGEIYAANVDLKVIEEIYYPIIRILRNEGGKELHFDRNSVIKIIEASSDRLLKEVPIKKFKENSLKLLEAMKDSDSSTFSVPEVEKFLKNIKIKSLKASSKEKFDITMVVHDHRTGLEPMLKMSIKSMLGSPSTLLNPGMSTNFIYKIKSEDFSDKDLEEVNNIEGRSKLIDRFNKLSEKGDLEFEKVQSKSFENNMKMIDTNLPEIMAYMLKLFYLYNHRSMKVLTEKVEEDDPLDFYKELALGFYSHKIKNLLLAIALGMTPSTPWSGEFSASGGYIVVKPSGQLVIYHVYNIDQFKDYLLNNTRIDKPSSSRYKYGKVYKEEGQYKIKLNLQIRFTA